MKKSELKAIIKECVYELNEAPTKDWKTPYIDLLDAIDLISRSKEKYENLETGYDKKIANELGKLYKLANSIGKKMIK